MTKEEKKAQRKADKLLLRTAAFELLSMYAIDPDTNKWVALGVLGRKLVELADARTAEG